MNKQGKEETPVEETPIEEATPSEEETPTEEGQEATPETQIPDWESKVKELETQLGEKDKSYKGLQKTLNKLNEKLSEQTSIDSRMTGLEERLEIMAALLDKRLASDDLSEAEKTDLKKEFANITDKVKREAEQTKFQERIGEYQKKTEELGLTTDDVEYWDIRDSVITGNFGKADALIKRISKSKETKEVPAKERKEETPPKTEEMTVEQLEELLAKKKGLLKTDSVVPSGKTMSDEDKLIAFGKGDTSISEVMKSRGF